MALKIRLARGGAKKRPFYQIVVADARLRGMVGLWKRWGPITLCFLKTIKIGFA